MHLATADHGVVALTLGKYWLIQVPFVIKWNCALIYPLVICANRYRDWKCSYSHMACITIQVFDLQLLPARVKKIILFLCTIFLMFPCVRLRVWDKSRNSKFVFQIPVEIIVPYMVPVLGRRTQVVITWYLAPKCTITPWNKSIFWHTLQRQYTRLSAGRVYRVKSRPVFGVAPR